MNETIEFRRNIEYIKENIRGLWDIIQRNPRSTVDNDSFNRLIRQTLEVFLDFKILQNPELFEADKLEIFNIYNQIIRTSQDQNIIKIVKSMIQTCTNGWNPDSFAMGLLNGKIGRRMGLGNVEKNIQNVLDEDNMVLETRIKKIKQLFEKTRNKKVLQMIVNFFETYKKLCISGRSFQDVTSYTCLVNILDNLLIALAALNMNEHLISMISLLPTMERLRILRKHHEDLGNSVTSTGLHTLKKSFVIFEILKSLLNDEFRKPVHKQNLLKCNLYIQYLLDFANCDYLINRNLEIILMMPVGMNVNTEYYYLVANSLRVKLPNKHEILVLKLYITGLSLDLSRLEDMKFDKALTVDDFKKVYHRIYLVLIILSSLIQDSVVKRQCVKVANVFEVTNDGISSQLSQILDLAYLPGEGLSYDKKKQVLEDLSNMLGNFNLEIKNNVKMVNYLEKIRPESFENFKYFNNNTRGVQKRLSPIHYPGIEAGYGRNDDSDSDDSTMNVTSSEEVRGNGNALNFVEIHERNRNFFQKISARLKTIKDPELYPTENRNEKQYDSKQIRDFYLNRIPMCTDFIVKDGQLYFKLSTISQNDIVMYNQYSTNLLDELIKKSDKLLMHDYSYRSGKYEIENIDLDAHYNLGRINVWHLASNDFSFYDISNVLFYSIVHKKSIYDTDVVKMFNQNNDEIGPPLKRAINFMIFRGQPEFSRVVRLITTLRTFNCIIEHNVENYDFFITNLSKYKFVRKKAKGPEENNVVEMNQEPEPLALIATSMDCSTSEPPTSVATEVDVEKIPKTPKIMKSRSKPDIETPESKYLYRQQQLRAHGVDRLQDVLRNMKRIQNFLSLTIGRKLRFDLSNFENLKIIYHNKKDVTSKIPVVLHRKNHKAEQRNSTKFSSIDVFLPEKIEASFEINTEEFHELCYDETTHDPFIKTNIVLKRITSHIHMLNTLTTFRCEVDIFEGSSNRGKIKISSKLDAAMKAPRPKPKSDSERTERSDSFEQSTQNEFTLNAGEIVTKIEIEDYTMGNSTSSICTRSSKEMSVIKTSESLIPQINQIPPVQLKTEFPQTISNTKTVEIKPVNYVVPPVTPSLPVPNQSPITTNLQNQMQSFAEAVQQNIPYFNQYNPQNFDGNVPMRETSVIKISPNKRHIESTYDVAGNTEIKKLLNQQSTINPEIASNVNMNPVVVISRDDVIMPHHLLTGVNTQINNPVGDVTTQSLSVVQQSPVVRRSLNAIKETTIESYPSLIENTLRNGVPRQLYSTVTRTKMNNNPVMAVSNINRTLNFENETVGNLFSQQQQPQPIISNVNMNPVVRISRDDVVMPHQTSEVANDQFNAPVVNVPVQPLPGFDQFSQFGNTPNSNKRARIESHSNPMENRNIPKLHIQSKMNEVMVNTNPVVTIPKSPEVPNISSSAMSTQITNTPVLTAPVLQSPPSCSKNLTPNINKDTAIVNRKPESNVPRSAAIRSPRVINQNSPVMTKQDVPIPIHPSLSVSDISNIIKKTAEVISKEIAHQQHQSAQMQGVVERIPNVNYQKPTIVPKQETLSSHTPILSDSKVTSNPYVALPKLFNVKSTPLVVPKQELEKTIQNVQNPGNSSVEVEPKPAIPDLKQNIFTPASTPNVDNNPGTVSKPKQEVPPTNPPKIVIQEDILIRPKLEVNMPLNLGVNNDKDETDFEELLCSNTTVLYRTVEQQKEERERIRLQAEKKQKNDEMKVKIEAERKLKEKRDQELAAIKFQEIIEQREKEKQEKELEEQRKQKLKEEREKELEEKRKQKLKEEREKEMKKISEDRQSSRRIQELRKQNEMREKQLKILMEERKQKANMANDNPSKIVKPVESTAIQEVPDIIRKKEPKPSKSGTYRKLVKNPFSIFHRQRMIQTNQVHAKMRKCSVKLRDYFEKIDKRNLGYDKIFVIKAGRTGQSTPNRHPSISSSPQPSSDEPTSILPD